MRSTSEPLPDIMRIRSHVKPLAAQHAKVDFRRLKSGDGVMEHVDQPGFAPDRVTCLATTRKGLTDTMLAGSGR